MTERLDVVQVGVAVGRFSDMRAELTPATIRRRVSARPVVTEADQRWSAG